MSEVRVCENCGVKNYAGEPGAPTERTIEYETDDGEILAAEWVLCGSCHQKITIGPTPVCPFCLETVLQDQDPRQCPQRSEVAR